jgi:SPX domain protein involved in polyphosphate accumulation
MKFQNVFERKEVKYTMTYDQYKTLREILGNQVTEDQYGLHTILSLYYDTPNFDMIQHSIAKPDYKEKFRVRSYGKALGDTPIYQEIKKKVNGIVYKRRVSQRYTDYSENAPLTKSQIANEIGFMHRKYRGMAPKVLIAYDRRALFGTEDHDFRVTFDFNIRYRTDDLNLTDDAGARVSPEVDVLMEVKALGAYPLWFSEALSQVGLQKASYSKYAFVYQRYILPQKLAA